MKFFTWNVNGIRAVARNGFMEWLKAARPDVLCLQELRATEAQFETEALRALGYHVLWHPAVKPGYSGVATLSLVPPTSSLVGLGEPRFDDEGRLVLTRHGDVTLINAYFPNAQRDLTRIDYKIDFYRALLVRAGQLRAAGEKVAICGDWNTAHRNIDIKNWRGNQKASGFTPAERALVDEYLAAGFTDAFREQHPTLADQYTWWSNRPGVRDKNVGWRIDYFLVDASLMPRVVRSHIHMDVRGADHCPVEIEIA